jgi:hypothetical protein
MNTMDKIKFPHIEQQLRLNRSVKSINTDKSLFYLYLSMLEKDLSAQPRFADNASTDEIVYEDIESHYYKHPALQFTNQDFLLQGAFSQAVVSQANSTLKLLNAFFPQGLSKHNNHLRIDDDVMDGLDFYAKQRIELDNSVESDVQSPTKTIPTDETMLYDLIPKVAEFSI